MTFDSDEDFLKNFDQSLDSLQEELEQNQKTEEEDQDTEVENVEDTEVEDSVEEPEEENEEDGEEGESDSEVVDEDEDEEDPEDQEEDEVEQSGGVIKPDTPKSAPSGSNEEDSDTQEEPDNQTDVDYKGFYESVMKPFKANGKTIELRSPDEAIQLMQMGANYTRKMQEISKHRKTIATLHENGITTDEDLAFILDIKNKNPDAIKKFFKDNNIDPFDVDTSEEVTYKPQVKMVSEEVLETRAVLDELNSDPEGAKTLRLIADTWDEESTRFMWNNPSAFKIIHEQRESGVYDQIMSEIDRQTTLGMLQPHGSILEKYNIVGNQLYGTGQPQSDTTRKPIDTRKASRSSAPSSNKRAKAARAPSSGKRTSSVVLEDLANLDDDKFLEAMKNRL